MAFNIRNVTIIFDDPSFRADKQGAIVYHLKEQISETFQYRGDDYTPQSDYNLKLSIRSVQKDPQAFLSIRLYPVLQNDYEDARKYAADFEGAIKPEQVRIDVSVRNVFGEQGYMYFCSLMDAYGSHEDIHDFHLQDVSSQYGKMLQACLEEKGIIVVPNENDILGAIVGLFGHYQTVQNDKLDMYNSLPPERGLD
jgi:hypothetical protein